MGLLGALFSGNRHGNTRFQGYNRGLTHNRNSTPMFGRQSGGCQGGNCAPSAGGLFGGLFGGGLFGGLFRGLFGGLFGGRRDSNYNNFENNNDGEDYSNQNDTDNETVDNNTNIANNDTNNTTKNDETKNDTNTKKDTDSNIDTSNMTPEQKKALGLTPAHEEFLNRLNTYRKSQGLHALKLNPNLCKGSLAHSKWMSNGGGMVHSNLKSVGQKGGYGGFVNSENIAAGQRSIAQVFNAWRNSAGHNANMLNSSATDVGFSFDKGYFTMVTGKNNNRNYNNYA